MSIFHIDHEDNNFVKKSQKTNQHKRNLPTLKNAN